MLRYYIKNWKDSKKVLEITLDQWEIRLTGGPLITCSFWVMFFFFNGKLDSVGFSGGTSG